VGEVAAWSTRASAYLVSAGQTRWQAGQAIGITAGAEKPEEGHAALHVTAARNDIEVEAQHDVLRLVSKDALKLRSVEETFEAAAKKRIRIATKAGASITLEDGNIFVECPGKLTIWRMQNDFNGPAFVEYGLEDHPENELKHPFEIRVARSPRDEASVWRGMPYKLYADGALIKEDVLDEQGNLRVDHDPATQKYQLEMINGTKFDIPVVTQYTNPLQGIPAARGFRKQEPGAAPEGRLEPKDTPRERFMVLLHLKKSKDD
jgi:type VI secretion system secreted protein VgrG